MKRMHVVIPMSGQGTRYQAAGYQEPKPLIPVAGIPMIERLLTALPSELDCTFILAENHRNSGLESLLTRLRPRATIAYVDSHSLGPGHALRQHTDHIPPDQPVLVSYCDYGMGWDFAQFEQFVRTTRCEACVVCYRGFHAHYLRPTNYAFCRMEGELVAEIREKENFTDNRENEFASCGAYYFDSRETLTEALTWQFDNDHKYAGEYYTSLTVDALIRSKDRAHVRVFENNFFFQWGTPQDLWDYEYWAKTYRSKLGTELGNAQVTNLVMPMAGIGSRFKGISESPKPFIKLDKVPMFRAALGTLPVPDHTAFVCLEAHREQFENAKPRGAETCYLKQTPQGQALSTAKGLEALANKDGDLIVSSCDHGIVLDDGLWERFRSDPACDAAIMTVTGFPGGTRQPEAFAWVVPSEDKSPFPLVEKVSVKKPVSNEPRKDHLLVGTFWFRTPGLAKEAIDELISRDLRVGGELYLDSVFNLMIEAGLRVRLVPLDGYLCWGDPDSLSESLYWQEVFGGHRLEVRPRFPGVE